MLNKKNSSKPKQKAIKIILKENASS